MLLEHVPALNARRLVLASASPRRKELLEQLGLKFEVRRAVLFGHVSDRCGGQAGRPAPVCLSHLPRPLLTRAGDSEQL